MVREFLYRDDLDGSTESVRTLSFAVEGQDYEIDLSEGNVQRFHEALEPFVSKGRQIRRQAGTTRRRGEGRRSEGGGRDDIPQIRAWAEANGHEVSARGRIKKEVIAALRRGAPVTGKPTTTTAALLAPSKVNHGFPQPQSAPVPHPSQGRTRTHDYSFPLQPQARLEA
jgi:hypothetical protein